MTANKKSFLIYFLLLSSITLFICVSLAISLLENNSFDFYICSFVYEHRTPKLTSILKFITLLGNWKFIILISIILLFSPRLRQTIGLPTCIYSIFSVICYSILKPLFARLRPDECFRLISENGFSYPSGHSMNCMVFYGILLILILRSINNLLIKKFIGLFFFALIFFIGFSRIYLGVHYPTDVIGGWSFGLFIISIFSLIDYNKNTFNK